MRTFVFIEGMGICLGWIDISDKDQGPGVRVRFKTVKNEVGWVIEDRSVFHHPKRYCTPNPLRGYFHLTEP